MINIQSGDDNECLKWCLGRYLNPTDHHPATTGKTDKCFAWKHDFKDLKFLVQIRDIYKVTVVLVSVFLVMRIEKISQSTLEKILFWDLLIYYW